MNTSLNRCGWAVLVCCCVLWRPVSAQSLSGLIVDENSNPVPYANVFIRELSSGAASDDRGRYFITLTPGNYHVVVSSVGYHSQSFEISIPDKGITRNIRLSSSATELQELVVKAKRRDPAFEIIQKVIDHKEANRKIVSSFRTSIYVRAVEVIDRRRKQSTEPVVADVPSGTPAERAEKTKMEETAKMAKLNLLEMQVKLHYQYPDHYKEERTAYKLYGNKEGLYVPVFAQADFNFYENLVDMKGIAEIPLISPVSRLAILSYKYKLEDILKEEGGLVYKIRVTPRKTGDATVKGVLFINDSTWSINRLELAIEKGALRFFDQFAIQQTYREISPNVWIPVRQEFSYETKTNKSVFKGSTVLVYSDFEKDVIFPSRFFGDELAHTTVEAYKRDSTFWKSARPEPLTDEQREFVAYRDSVEAVVTSKRYLDSMDSKMNKVTLGEVLYHGVSFRNSHMKREVSFASLLSLVDFAVVGGFRLGPYASYFRRYENDRTLWLNSTINYGLKNGDVQGQANFWWRYDPYHLGDFGGYVGRNFYTIYPADAYLNQLKVSNYILHEHVDFFYRREFLNGLYFRAQTSFANRRSLDGMNATSIINSVYDQGAPLVFEDYKAFITDLRLSYTPRQQYLSEPTRKVVLGSKYPTVSILHRKGWNQSMGSDIDFDYLEVGVEQSVLLGTLGTSKYNLMAGKFVNTRDLRFIDVKRFRQSDPVLYSQALNSFQLLDTSLATTNWFAEAHYIHHFNGAMINNLPLIKKTRIRTVVGGGAMWIYQNNFRHQELFAGLERVFKLGPRRRLRLGVYGILGQSNNTAPKTDFKVSFDIIDTWKVDWNY